MGSGKGLASASKRFVVLYSGLSNSPALAIEKFLQVLATVAMLLANSSAFDVCGLDVRIVCWCHLSRRGAAPCVELDGRWRWLLPAQLGEALSSALLQLELAVCGTRRKRVAGAIPRVGIG